MEPYCKKFGPLIGDSSLIPFTECHACAMSPLVPSVVWVWSWFYKSYYWTVCPFFNWYRRIPWIKPTSTSISAIVDFLPWWILWKSLWKCPSFPIFTKIGINDLQAKPQKSIETGSEVILAWHFLWVLPCHSLDIMTLKLPWHLCRAGLLGFHIVRSYICKKTC